MLCNKYQLILYIALVTAESNDPLIVWLKTGTSGSLCTEKDSMKETFS